MKFWNFSTQALATLLACVSAVYADANPDAPAGEEDVSVESFVEQLNSKNFKQFLEDNPLVLGEFYAPWCGYCKKLAPEYEKAATILHEMGSKIKLAKVDCTEEQTLCQQHNIKGYPTMKVIRGPYNQPDDYEGPREAEGIVETMIKYSLPPVQKVESVDDFLSAAKSSAKPFYVQILPSVVHESAAANNVTYGEIAFSQRGRQSYYSIEDDEVIAKVAEQVNVEIPTDSATYLAVHPNELDDVRVFSGAEFSKAAFEDWATDALVPDFGDINRDTYMIYMSSTLPLAYFFYNTAEERAAVAEFLEKKGKELRGTINFVGLDATQFGKHAEILNMDPTIVPLFAIQNNSNGRKYGINQVDHPTLTVDLIEEFIGKFLAGEVEHIVKSEPLPTQEEIDAQAVTKLVAHNYDEILGDQSKNVFVEYYAPWCGHCKKLAPIWEEVAEEFKSSDVVIANVDHTQNDVDTPLVIEGYPTLIFYPANGGIDEKSGVRAGVVYTSGRDKESLLEFIEKNKNEASAVDEEDAEEEDVPEVAEGHDEL